MTFDIIQNNQFSTFLLAMSHIAVMAEEETKESSPGVLLSVSWSSTRYKTSQLVVQIKTENKRSE